MQNAKLKIEWNYENGSDKKSRGDMMNECSPFLVLEYTRTRCIEMLTELQRENGGQWVGKIAVPGVEWLDCK